jgi:hypothetical protein
MAFNKLKEAIINTTKLTHFHTEYPLLLATDASSYGIGAVLSHKYPNGEERPIAFASKTLNKAQQAYSQIEKEALSIIYGVTKFYQYLYGRKFKLLTDHKPLVALFKPDKKLPIHTINRLQRWAIILMGFEYTIAYKPTKEHGNADALSRLPMGNDPEFDDSEEACQYIDKDSFMLLESSPINAKNIQEFMAIDNLMQVRKYIEQDWPEAVKEPQLKSWWHKRNSLSIYNNVILLQTDSTRIVIPEKLQNEVF